VVHPGKFLGCNTLSIHCRLFYLLSYPHFPDGTFLIPHKKPKTLDTVKKILDTSTSPVIFVFIFWNLIIGPHISIFREETGGICNFLAYRWAMF